MRVSNHELTVRRNETFTLDKIVQNRDGSPYIISSELKNPYFLVTVSSTLYENDDSYTYHAWLPVELPRFHSTIPVKINDFTSLIGAPLYNGFDNMTGPPSGYINGSHIIYEGDASTPCYDALFYYEDEDDKTYKWWSGENGWQDYECRIIHKFLQQYTGEWVERSYFYNIDLVDGTKNENASSGERPLENISELIPILEPTKVSVLSNLKGGMKWAR